MTIMAAICGVLIVFLGLLSAGHNPTEGQSTVQILCLIGGLILCFIAVVLARLALLGRRLDAFEAVAEVAGETASSIAPRMETHASFEKADSLETALGVLPSTKAADSGGIEAAVLAKPPD